MPGLVACTRTITRTITRARAPPARRHAARATAAAPSASPDGRGLDEPAGGGGLHAELPEREFGSMSPSECELTSVTGAFYLQLSSASRRPAMRPAPCHQLIRFLPLPRFPSSRGILFLTEIAHAQPLGISPPLLPGRGVLATNRLALLSSAVSRKLPQRRPGGELEPTDTPALLSQTERECSERRSGSAREGGGSGERAFPSRPPAISSSLVRDEKLIFCVGALMAPAGPQHRTR
ncbi:unnamed protein product [Lampetra fluviatilis]